MPQLLVLDLAVMMALVVMHVAVSRGFCALMSQRRVATARMLVQMLILAR